MMIDDTLHTSHLTSYTYIHIYLKKNVLPSIRLFFPQKKTKKSEKTWIHMTYNSLSEKKTQKHENSPWDRMP